jgi:hypothetical protein
MTEPKKLPKNALITPPVRLAFPSLFAMRRTLASDPNSKLAYQAAFLLPPGTDLVPFEKILTDAMISKFGKPMPFAKGTTRYPIRAAEENGAYASLGAGWHFINTKSGQQVPVVDRTNTPVVPDEDEDPERPGHFRRSSKIYSGLWVRAFLQAFAWDKGAGKGVSFGLNGVQIVRDDDRIDGRMAATDVFTPLEDAGDVEKDLIG